MTAQIPEKLIFEGEETWMTFCPPLPEGHSRIIKIDPESMPEPDDLSNLILFSTACWRHYQGTWEIKDGRFYLVNLEGCVQLQKGESLLADWFSGIIRIPKGEILHYVHMGFGSVYEQEIHIKIEHGLIVASRDIDNHGKKFDDLDKGLKNLPGFENIFDGDNDF